MSDYIEVRWQISQSGFVVVGKSLIERAKTSREAMQWVLDVVYDDATDDIQATQVELVNEEEVKEFINEIRKGKEGRNE